MIYDERVVKAHGQFSASVYLMNEAPGDNEAISGVPLFASQGGVLYRLLKKSNIKWALSFNGDQNFKWPTKPQDQYVQPQKKENDFNLRELFLLVRAEYITCSNAFDRWPKRNTTSNDDSDPLDSDVLSISNINRIKNEITTNHEILLICGEFSWLVCFGESLRYPSKKECNMLTENELKILNTRLDASFQAAFYMGHTRRWNLKEPRVIGILSFVAQRQGWS